MTHVIGDSHVNLFRTELYIVHWLGAVTAYNLISPISTTNSNRKLLQIIQSFRHNTNVVLSAGEIDCRIHIYYQYKKNNEKHPISEYISKTIDRYLDILYIVEAYNINLFVLGIPPAGTEANIYNYRWYAPPDIRAEIYYVFNTGLKKQCIDTQRKYIDIYSRTVNSNGFIQEGYTNDGVHLNRNALPVIESMIKKEGI